MFLQIVYSQYNLTWIETAFQNWTLSSTQFYRPAAWSIVGYDSDHDVAIIFGGAPGMWNVDKADWYNLYIYDLMKDTLTTVPIAWDISLYGWLVNQLTTNAVIINSTMYFSITDHVLLLQLDPIYTYYLNEQITIRFRNPSPTSDTTRNTP